jgi:16S rRNA (cytidine1402-2'-O)-methyltransferase
LPGTLYLVASPIGNLEDITLRALRVLRTEASFIACEDTRQTQKLLEHYQIRKPLISYHEHNEIERAAEIAGILEGGESVALVSDAGTPLISDPGYRVVNAAIEKNIPVVPLPGASALLAALAASGLAVHEFSFIGFLPSKSGARRKTIERIAEADATVVAYETPHRILDALADMGEILGGRPIALAREITKVHEEFLRGSSQAVLKQLQQRGSVKGEITLVIGPPEEKTDIGDPLQEIAKLQEEAGLGRMEAIKAVARRMGLPKREVYRLASEQDSSRPNKRRP